MTAPSSPTDRDRFIPGIYNYCDSWCSACPLATRCRLKVSMDAEAAPDTPEAFAAQVRRWFRTAHALVEERARALGADIERIQALDDAAQQAPLVSLDHARLVSRAKAYGQAVFSWQRRRPPDLQQRHELDPTFPQDVIDHFAFFIGAKVHRAVSVRAFQQETRKGDEGPSDADGTAKVAILAVERSRAAWSDLRDSGLVGTDAVQAFEESLTWLIDELDRVFPDARRFVRPGFDAAAINAPNRR